MKRDADFYLRDILEAIKDIESFTRGATEEKFRKDKKTQYAVVRSLEIIGEAVKHIPADTKRASIHIPWSDIAGMRDIMIHEYFGVHVGIVWKTVTDDLPSLKKEIQEML